MFGIANWAGGVLAGRSAPGELISIYGLKLGPAAPVSAASNSSGFLPTTLGEAVTLAYSGAAPDDVNGRCRINFEVSAAASFGYT